MALTANEVKVAPSGHVYVGPLGSVEPDDPTTTPNAAIKELGYATPEGVSITPNVESEGIPVWQSLTPVLYPITSFEFELSFTLVQTNQEVMSLFFTGSEFTNDGGIGRLDISSNPGTQERLLIVDWVDNSGNNYRLVVPRAQMTNREALSLQRSEAMAYGITFMALDDDGVTAYLLTDNPVLVPAS